MLLADALSRTVKMTSSLGAGVHDVAQPFAGIHVVLISRKAIPTPANRVLKVLLGGDART
jgi:hypothetical protein